MLHLPFDTVALFSAAATIRRTRAEGTRRAMEAMLEMQRIDVAAMRAAYEGR